MSTLRIRLSWQDVLLPAGLLIFGLLGTGPAGENQPHTERPVDLLAYLLVAVAAVALVPRRRLPYVSATVCGAVIVTYFVAGYPFGPILLTGPAIGYAVFQRVPARRAIVLVTIFVALTAAAVVPRFLGAVDGSVADALAWCIAWTGVVSAPAAVGAGIRTRQLAAAEVLAAQSRRAVSEERLRMAQDLHDSIGHSLAVIAMQAGVAIHVLDDRPDRARESLEAIRNTSREALQGLRAELDELRDPTGDAPQRRPNPGLSNLQVLIDRMRAGGLTIHFDLDADDQVTDAVGQAAYRIVQESLTNVLRHAEGATATVRVRRGDEALTLEVTDSGASNPSVRTDAGSVAASGVAPSGGTGIDGMRARAAAVGGELTAGPGPTGGFTVRATLPIAPSGSPTSTAPRVAGATR